MTTSEGRAFREVDKNDPFRFQKGGVNFRAKLIGMDEIPDARGDKMCQESIHRLKAAVKASGEHKQRITVNVSIQGIKIFDEKSAVEIHRHPVHRISFISRDVTDARAFGYIYGPGDSSHKFFAIKTEKAAENLVLTLRDLFQVVFELKKKEVEEAKKKEEEKKDGKEDGSTTTTEEETKTKESSEETVKAEEQTTESSRVANLLDFELATIQEGINQMNAFDGLSLTSDSQSDSSMTPNPGRSSSAWSTGTGSAASAPAMAVPFTAFSQSTPPQPAAQNNFATAFNPAPSPANSDPFMVSGSINPPPSQMVANDPFRMPAASIVTPPPSRFPVPPGNSNMFSNGSSINSGLFDTGGTHPMSNGNGTTSALGGMNNGTASAFPTNLAQSGVDPWGSQAQNNPVQQTSVVGAFGAPPSVGMGMPYGTPGGPISLSPPLGANKVQADPFKNDPFFTASPPPGGSSNVFGSFPPASSVSPSNPFGGGGLSSGFTNIPNTGAMASSAFGSAVPLGPGPTNASFGAANPFDAPVLAPVPVNMPATSSNDVKPQSAHDPFADLSTLGSNLSKKDFFKDLSEKPSLTSLKDNGSKMITLQPADPFDQFRSDSSTI